MIQELHSMFFFCDHPKHEEHSEDYPYFQWRFNANTRKECLDAGLKAGWKITRARVVCPGCNGKV